MEGVLGVARTACRGRPWATPPPAAMREAVRSGAACGRRTAVTEPSPAVEADATAGTHGGAGGDRGGGGRIHDAASVGCAAAQTAIAGVAPAAGGAAPATGRGAPNGGGVGGGGGGGAGGAASPRGLRGAASGGGDDTADGGSTDGGPPGLRTDSDSDGASGAGRSPTSGGTLELMGVHAFGAATTGEAWAVVPADPSSATVVGGRVRRELTDADALSLDASAGAAGWVPSPSTLGLGLTAERQLTPRVLGSLCLRSGRGAGVSLSVDRSEMEVDASDAGSSDEEDDDDDSDSGGSGADDAAAAGAPSSDSDASRGRRRQRRRHRPRRRPRRRAGAPPDPAAVAVVKPWARLSALDKAARLVFTPLTAALSPTVWAPVSAGAGLSLGASGADVRLSLRRPVGAGAPLRLPPPSAAAAAAAASPSATRRRAAAAAAARARRRAWTRRPGDAGPYVEASAGVGLSSGSWSVEGGGGRRWASATSTGLSLRYASDGLTLRVVVSRGGHALSVPLLLAGGGVADVAAAASAAAATAAVAAVIEVGVIAPLRAALAAAAATAAREHRRAAAAAERAEAAGMTELLAEAVAASERREAAAQGGGLLIERAVYGARGAVEAEPRRGPPVVGQAAEEERELIEVRAAIQALVEASVVQVAAASKTELMGVWDPTAGGAAAPKSLRVWYRFRGRPHVCTVKDGGVLEMPLSKHLVEEDGDA